MSSHRRVLAAAALLLAGACHKRAYPIADAGGDALGTDAAAGDVPHALAVDFAATGCARYDVGAARCTGTAPLAVSFSPVSSAALTRFVWTFGDGSPTSSERVPVHTYALPGTYDVTLVAAGDVGSVSRTRARFVEVMAVAAGATCDVDAQCAAGLRCLCGAGDSCGAMFPRGVCTKACPTGACTGGAICATVDLPGATDGGATDAAAPADGGDAAASSDAAGTGDGAATGDGAVTTSGDATPGGGRAPLCLVACADDTGCPAGLVCRGLLAPPQSTSRWVRACVPPAYREIGDACRDPSGQLDGRACASGTCSALGALGVCAASCGAGAECPPGAACATFGNGQTLCLQTCASATACAHDPLLRCEAPGGAGALGFQISPSTANTTYCAPRTCAAQTDCGPAGACTPLGASGHCVKG